MITIIVGDLTAVACDAIVNPANSRGTMGGGVAAAIRQKGGMDIEREAIAQAPIPIGETALTSAGSLPCKHVIHAPTMEEPSEPSSFDFVRQAVEAARWCAEVNKFKTVAFPGMGTGAGGVSRDQVAMIMIDELKNAPFDVILVAHAPELKAAWEEALKVHSS